jgi:uncharacterized coiled-coil protein SlyX
MENIRQIQLLEELEQLTKQIALVIIEKQQNVNNYNEKLKILYNRMSQIYKDFNKLIPSLTNHTE